MERFIARENLRMYRARVEAENNSATRETLSKLIIQEEAKEGGRERSRIDREGVESLLSDATSAAKPAPRPSARA